MLRKTILFLILAIFQIKASALNRVIPCEVEQCSNTSLLKTVALKNTEDLVNQPATIYFFNKGTKTSEYFNVVRLTDPEFGQFGNGITQVFGPFPASSEKSSIIEEVYRLESQFIEINGDPNHPPPRDTLIGSDGVIIGEGYAGIALGMNGWSYVTIGTNVNYVGTTAWLNIINTRLMSALQNLVGGTWSNLIDLLNSSISQQQVLSSQLNATQWTGGAQGIVFHLDGTVTDTTGKAVTITSQNLPTQIPVVLSDGIINFVYSPTKQGFIVTSIIDSGGNTIKVNEDGTITEDGIPDNIIITPENIENIKVLAQRLDMTALWNFLENVEITVTIIVKKHPST